MMKYRFVDHSLAYTRTACFAQRLINEYNPCEHTLMSSSVANESLCVCLGRNMLSLLYDY